MQNGRGGPQGRDVALSRSAQLIVLAVSGAALAFALLVVPAVVKSMGPKPDAEQAPPPAGTFRPTPEQWKALTFVKVGDQAFAPTLSTEGQIATDDDVTVQITPPFSGRVVSVAVKAGDHVAKGQTLLTAAASEVAQAESDLATATANLAAAKTQLATATANAERQQALLKIDGAATKDVQQSQSDLATAAATFHADEAALKAVHDRIAILNVGSLKLASAKTGVATLPSPISGVVMLRSVGPGQYLNSTANGATTPIFTVSDLSKVWLVANVREDDASRLHVGQAIDMHVAAFPGRTFKATLDYVAPMIDPATRRLPVRAVIANPDGALKPAMFADFVIKTGADQTAVAVPTAAVIYEGDEARVWVAEKGQSLGLREIKTGRTSDGEVEVLSGLNPGDQVVVSGAIFIDRAAKSD
jgi:cobalt-zinc-cadmium efflux system membrane fusion protein